MDGGRVEGEEEEEEEGKKKASGSKGEFEDADDDEFQDAIEEIEKSVRVDVTAIIVSTKKGKKRKDRETTAEESGGETGKGGEWKADSLTSSTTAKPSDVLSEGIGGGGLRPYKTETENKKDISSSPDASCETEAHSEVQISVSTATVEVHWQQRSLKQILATLREYRSMMQRRLQTHLEELEKTAAIGDYTFLSKEAILAMQQTLHSVKQSLSYIDVQRHLNMNNDSPSSFPEENSTRGSGGGGGGSTRHETTPISVPAAHEGTGQASRQVDTVSRQGGQGGGGGVAASRSSGKGPAMSSSTGGGSANNGGGDDGIRDQGQSTAASTAPAGTSNSKQASMLQGAGDNFIMDEGGRYGKPDRETTEKLQEAELRKRRAEAEAERWMATGLAYEGEGDLPALASWKSSTQKTTETEDDKGATKKDAARPVVVLDLKVKGAAIAFWKEKHVSSLYRAWVASLTVSVVRSLL